MARSAGSAIFIFRAASPIAPSKQADQPAANSCSGLVPTPAVPGDESLMSRRPSELRDAPSRPPEVWVLPVYSTFSSWVMAGSLLKNCLLFVSALIGCDAYLREAASDV